MPASAVKAIKLTFGIALLAVLLLLVDLQELASALGVLTWWSILLLLYISFVLIFISALKWKLFLDNLGAKQKGSSGTVKLNHLIRLYLVGYFVNLLMPSYFGGDAVRSYYIGKRVGQHTAAAATILERYTGLVAMIVLALLSLAVSRAVPMGVQIAVFALGIFLAIGTVLVLSERLMTLIRKLPGSGVIVPHLEKVQAGFLLAKSNRGLLLKTLVLSLLFHLTTVVNTLVAGAAVGWYGASFIDLTIVLPLILIIGALPVAPSGLGLQEGAFVFFLQGVGATPAQALALGLVLRAKSYVLAVFGWGMWIVEKRVREEGEVSIL